LLLRKKGFLLPAGVVRCPLLPDNSWSLKSAKLPDEPDVCRSSSFQFEVVLKPLRHEPLEHQYLTLVMRLVIDEMVKNPS
jgi:hypothetical protein